MKATIFISFILTFTTLEAQHWTAVQDTIITNNVYMTLGTQSKDWKDARLLFRFDGDRQVLLEGLSKIHNGEFVKEAKKERYKLSNTVDPLMFYSDYDVLLDYHENEDCYTLFVKYSFNKKKEDGRLLHDSHTFFVREHYQPLLNNIAVSP